MRISRTPFWLVLLAFLACPSLVLAQKYPEKSIRLLLGYQTGVAYTLGLLLSDKLRDVLGQPVAPEFRLGAAGNIALELAAKSPPDGYTLAIASTGFIISPSLFPKLGYHPFRDFAPITLLASVPNAMVIHPSVPAKTLAELVQLAKAHPGKLNYGSGGIGSSAQLGSELFKTLNKINIVHVPYKGAAIAMSAMLSGEVDLVTSSVPATIPLVNSGKIRALVVTAEKRVAALPNVPTAAEAGMPELIVITWWSLLAPAGTKPDIIGTLNAAAIKVLNTPEVKAKFAQVDLDVLTSTPAGLGKFARDEYEKWGRVIKEANIRVQQ